MSPVQLLVFQNAFNQNFNQNPNTTVNFVPFDPNNSSNPGLAIGATSASEFNLVTADQTTTTTLPTLQEIE